jgi:hypothetical protein
VLLDIAERQPPAGKEGQQALADLRKLKTKIKRLKAQ